MGSRVAFENFVGEITSPPTRLIRVVILMDSFTGSDWLKVVRYYDSEKSLKEDLAGKTHQILSRKDYE